MRALLIIALSILSQVVAAQQIEPIETDRPDQTETPSLVPVGYFQIEAGVAYEQLRAGQGVITLPTILSRYGVNDRFEIRLLTEVLHTHYFGYRMSGLAPIELGIKTNLIQEKGVIPKISFLGSISTNIASPKFKRNYLNHEFIVAFEHTVSDVVSIGYNLGGEWDGSSGGEFIFTLTSGISLTDQVGIFFETFTSDGHLDFDTGMSYLPTPDIQFDLSGGIGTFDFPNYFIAIGGSFRFHP